MSVANKLSQAYDGVEDRILLLSEDDQGSICRLWLTQRMTNKVVAALVKWLGEQSASQLPQIPADTAQTWNQAAAVSQFIPSAPVNVSSTPPPLAAVAPSASEGLVKSIDVQRSGESYMLIFHLGTEPTLASAFSPVELRQWLSILHGLYQTAGWSMDIWPIWMANPIATAAPNRVN
jgi:hypothetical protein